MDNLVTISTYTFPTELAVSKAILQSEDIEYFVRDEMTVQVLNFHSNAIGGVKLQVRASDAERATELLNKQFEDSNEGPFEY